LKRDYWIVFAIISMAFLCGVVAGTVTVPKGQALPYPQKVRE
jgi:hypothetical protein